MILLTQKTLTKTYKKKPPWYNTPEVIFLNYGIYKTARNASWQCLIDCDIHSLPVRPVEIAKHYNIKCKKMQSNKLGCSAKIKTIFGKTYILYNADDTRERQRYSIMHELGHYLLGHHNYNEDDEYQAERFAIDILAPACVLWGLNLHTAQEISDVCNISITSAQRRAERMEVLYQRNMFLSHPLERAVFNQFRDFMNQNK